jgi:hypothetical protein
MRFDHQSTRPWFVRSCVAATAWLLLLAGGSTGALAQSSVEKSETSQQAKQPEDELARARAAVTKPNEPKPAPPETGRLWGDYSVTSSFEVGYRFVDTDGSRLRYLSDVNVRDGLRLLDYSLDARSISGQGLLFDFLRADVQNAGGDQSQYFSVRADKTRAYRFDGTVRRFNYFRSLATFANNQHNYDLRQQVSDFNLKLFPQRPVRINLAYGRSIAKGPFVSTYNYERDEFPVQGRTRWEANDYRLGLDVTYRGWDFFAEQMHRHFRNDTEFFQTAALNPGNNPTNNSVLTFFDRDAPARARAFVTRGSLRGNITPRLHLVLRGLHNSERLNLTGLDQTAGTDFSNRKILARTIVDRARVKRPSSTADAVLTYDLAERVAISNTFRYTSYRILGHVDAVTQSRLQPVTGPLQTPTVSTFDNRATDLASYWNTLEVHFALGTKVAANLGWRAAHRDVTLSRPGATEEEEQTTHSFIGGLRYRPTKQTSFFFDVEHGESNNAFVRINPLEFTRFRVRANIQATNTLSFTSTFTSTDRTNPTRLVENDADFRSVSVSAFWQPNARVWVTGGYDYDYLFSTADIAFFISNVLNRGRSQYYARQNFAFADARFGLTRRLDLLLVYRYLQDRGAPALVGTPGPNDFVTALPLRRHNPEARLAYRFNNHVTGNVSYRHYSYNERNFFVQDYRANILTTSVRFTF